MRVTIRPTVEGRAWAFASWSPARLAWFFGHVEHALDAVTGRPLLTPPAWAARSDERVLLACTVVVGAWPQVVARLWERVADRAEALRRPQPWHVVEGTDVARPEGLARLGSIARGGRVRCRHGA